MSASDEMVTTWVRLTLVLVGAVLHIILPERPRTKHPGGESP